MMPPEFTLSDVFPPVSHDQWRSAVQKVLKGAAFEQKLVTQTYEGVDIQPLYTRRDWDSGGDPSGFPGMPPFVRGGRPLGNVMWGWDVRQEHAHPDLMTTKAAVLDDFKHGATSVLLRFDAAGRAGLDPDASEAVALAGRDGVMIYSQDDLRAALEEVRLETVRVCLEAGSAFLPAAAMLVALWDRDGVDRAATRGAFNADPLSTLAADGRLPFSLEQSFRHMAELASWTSENLPNVTAVCINTGVYHTAGATAVQDLAYSMATGIEYLRAMTAAGMDVDAATRQIEFDYSIGPRFYLAICKLRAARKLWARVVEVSGGSVNAQAMRMHVRPSFRILTRRDPWANQLRNTVCHFAGAVAGADSITTVPFDTANGLPDDFSRRIARNTQVILREEAHLGRVIDPAGGSWFLEKLTEGLAAKAWSILQEVERRGGMVKALLSGWVARQIDSAFAPRMKNLATRRDAITGVSEFPNVKEQIMRRETPDYAALRAQAVERMLERGKADIAAGPLERVMRLLEAGGPVSGKVVATMVEAATGGATVGRMVRALAAGGDGMRMDPLVPRRYAQAFEELRDLSDRLMALGGSRPRVFLVNIGSVAQHWPRATWSRNFFEVGGFEVLKNDGFGDVMEATDAFKGSGARIAVICSSDGLYETVVADVTPRLKEAGAHTVILAGSPGRNEKAYRKAGIDRFIFAGCDVLRTLQDLLRAEGGTS
ncbi:MAG: methylmalonyl-CoA mutase small subunit [Phycisphaerales bacterium]|nr:MAG: methylmalonyl-CoA mutase small subunit [Phycisphaerales bacterium]